MFDLIMRIYLVCAGIFFMALAVERHLAGIDLVPCLIIGIGIGLTAFAGGVLLLWDKSRSKKKDPSTSPDF